MISMTSEEFMYLAIEEAYLSVKEGNGPFTVVVVNAEGKIEWKDHDRVKETMDPTAHGEVNAIRYLCKNKNTLTLDGYTFYTTSEPCPTCLSSMIKVKASACYYGCKTQSTASLPVSAEELAQKANNKITVVGGILEKQCLAQRDQYTMSNR